MLIGTSHTKTGLESSLHFRLVHRWCDMLIYCYWLITTKGYLYVNLKKNIDIAKSSQGKAKPICGIFCYVCSVKMINALHLPTADVWSQSHLLHGLATGVLGSISVCRVGLYYGAIAAITDTFCTGFFFRVGPPVIISLHKTGRDLSEFMAWAVVMTRAQFYKTVIKILLDKFRIFFLYLASFCAYRLYEIVHMAQYLEIFRR